MLPRTCFIIPGKKWYCMLQDFEKWYATAFMITGRRPRGFIRGTIRYGLKLKALQSGQGISKLESLKS